jgi:peptidoglycan/LPS O-acetylase OafA/YrhL
MAGSRLPALTGIRILAALAVYASHVGAPAGAPTALDSFFASGYMGVTLFFVLSGFVLAFNYLDDMRRPSVTGVYDYLVARFARVYPLYLLLLLCYMAYFGATGEGVEGWWRNALAIQAWDPSLARAYSFDEPSWSISVEFFLYACFPLLIPLLARLRRPGAILLAAAGVAAAMIALAGWFVVGGGGALPMEDPDSAHRWLYRMPLTRLGDFALGILAAMLYLTVRGDRSVARLGLPLVLGSTLTTVALMCWPATYFTAWSWDVAYAIPAAVFIFGLAVAPLSWAAKALSLPFMVLLGEASYAFYLVHAPGIDIFGAGEWATELTAVTVVREALALGAVAALAIVLHLAFERPARTRIRRAFSRRRRPESTRSRPVTEPIRP